MTSFVLPLLALSLCGCPASSPQPIEVRVTLTPSSDAAVPEDAVDQVKGTAPTGWSVVECVQAVEDRP